MKEEIILFTTTMCPKCPEAIEWATENLTLFKMVKADLNDENMKLAQDMGITSRYGIMEQLNNRKINEKEKLTNIEKEVDTYVYESEKKITEVKRQVEDKTANYKRVHADWKREKQVQLKLLTQDFNRQKIQIETDIAEAEKGYEAEFQDWKKKQVAALNEADTDLKRYQETSKKKIDAKVATITEIDRGINDLKEVSKEQ